MKIKSLISIVLVASTFILTGCPQDSSSSLDMGYEIVVFTSDTTTYSVQLYDFQDELVTFAKSSGNSRISTPEGMRLEKKFSKERCRAKVKRIYGKDSVFIGLMDMKAYSPETPIGIEGLNNGKGWTMDVWWNAVENNKDFDYSPYLHLMLNRPEASVIVPKKDSIEALIDKWYPCVFVE